MNWHWHWQQQQQQQWQVARNCWHCHLFPNCIDRIIYGKQMGVSGKGIMDGFVMRFFLHFLVVLSFF
jgi:hypothetical protein